MIEIKFQYTNGIINTIRTKDIIQFTSGILFIGSIKFVEVESIVLIKKVED